MKRLCCVCLLLLCAGMLIHAETQSNTFYNEYVAELAKDNRFFPRHEGSDGENDLFTYINKKITESGFTADSHDFSDLENAHSFSSYLETTISGGDAFKLVFIVPVNQPPGTENSRPYIINTALALSIIEHYSDPPPAITLKFIFTGAEFGIRPEYPLGSRYLSTQLDKESAVLYMNLRSLPDRLLIETGGRKIVSPYWLVTDAAQALKTSTLPFLIQGNKNQNFRLGLSESHTPVNPYLQNEIPALLFESRTRTAAADTGDYADFAERFTSFIDYFCHLQASRDTRPWDQHYVFFQIYSNYLIIAENQFIWILLITASFFIFLIVSQYYKIIHRLKFLLRHALIVLVFCFSCFVLLYISTIVLEYLSSIKEFPDMWSYASLQFLLEKVLLALFLFTLIAQLSKLLDFTRSYRLYYSAAVMLLLFNSIFTLVLNISFSYYMIWALLFTLLSLNARKSAVKIILLLPSPLLILKAAYDIFQLPQKEIIRFILVDPVTGNIFLTLVLMPFVFLCMGIWYEHNVGIKHYRAADIAKRVVLISVFGVSWIVSFIVILNHDPFAEGSIKQPVLLSEHVIMDTNQHFVSIESPKPIGNLRLKTQNETYTMSYPDAARADLPFPNKHPLTAKVNSRQFLDRVFYNIRLNATGKPYFCELKLFSDEDVIVFDLNYPYTLQPESNSCMINVGSYPQFPLVLEVTSFKEINLAMEIKLHYLDPPYKLEFMNRNIKERMETYIRDIVFLPQTY